MSSSGHKRSATPADPLDAIEQRITGMSEWLRENAPYCFHDQNHLDADTPERAYWHYGYLVALKDMRRLLRRRQTS
jgi:hypothetical protein